ncbi:MAG TPA: glycosyltransferase family 39 protein [Acidimicrobiales bacterium]|nr:glycosyltransferase family 39 protein [Acidimicrobiales bacterium]
MAGQRNSSAREPGSLLSGTALRCGIPSVTEKPTGLARDGLPERLSRTGAIGYTPGMWWRRQERVLLAGGLAIVLVASAVLYWWRLGDWGWGYAYYSGAVEAGSQSFQAAIFGALDQHGLVTIDKGPASLWPSVVAVRVFGLSPWTVLGPYAIEGVATVALVYATVAQWAGRWAGLGAGAIVCTTPVVVASFRFNNPDALLTMLSVAALYCAVRAGDTSTPLWAWCAGALLGLGFLTKFLAVGMVLPAVALALVTGCRSRRARAAALVRTAVGALAACGWWLALVSIVPASDRPFIGGTSDDSVWTLIFGYDGFNRLTGHGFTGARVSFGHALWTASLRLFGGQMGAQIGWLLPLALLLLVVGMVGTRVRPARQERAGLAVWGTWLLVAGAVLSSGQGLINAYYTVVLAPAVAAVVAIGASVLFQRWGTRTTRFWAAGVVALSGVWAFDLLDRERGWAPWLRYCLVFLGFGIALVIATVERPRRPWRYATVTAAVTACTLLAGPVAYAVGTATGPVPSTDPMAHLPGLSVAVKPGPVGGGVTDISRPPAALVNALEREPTSVEWVVAVVGGDPAAGYELATGRAAMAIGGWRGTDPVPTLRRFQHLVADGKIGYFIPAGPADGVYVPRSDARSPARQITAWVSRHFVAATIGGERLFDLERPKP